MKFSASAAVAPELMNAWTSCSWLMPPSSAVQASRAIASCSSSVAGGAIPDPATTSRNTESAVSPGGISTFFAAVVDGTAELVVEGAASLVGAGAEEGAAGVGAAEGDPCDIGALAAASPAPDDDVPITIQATIPTTNAANSEIPATVPLRPRDADLRPAPALRPAAAFPVRCAVMSGAPEALPACRGRSSGGSSADQGVRCSAARDRLIPSGVSGAGRRRRPGRRHTGPDREFARHPDVAVVVTT